MVKTTHAGSGTPNSSDACSRQRKTSSDARMAARCPPRPGLAQLRMAFSIACATVTGFISVVAALSR